VIELTRWKSAAIVAGALAVVGTVGTSLLASCAATPVSVPIQSFQRPQSVDVVCLHVLDENGHSIVPAIPVPQAACAPVPNGDDGLLFQYQLYAMVTQTTTGEVALVDLSGGYVVDEDPGTPGTNFLPVGTLPSDIAVTPDGIMSFVGSATPNAPAIYGLPSSIILGNSQAAPPDGGPLGILPTLTTWPACSLEQAPGALVVVPTVAPTVAAAPSVSDAGEDAESDAGAAAPSVAGLGYVLVAVLPGDTAHSAKIVTIDPAPMMRGAGKYVTLPSLDPNGPAIAPGSLERCPVLQTIELAAPALSTQWTSGPAWDDGVKYVDGGVDGDVPLSGVACVASDAGPAPLFPGPIGSPRGGSAAIDTASSHPILYVADTQLPVIHVIDVSNPSAPVELAPLLATSLASPGRAITVGKIAVSPPTREFKRFLYAIDQKEGDVMVYDVTDPATSPHVPLTRPHPEIDPFQPPDRVLFESPVAALSFVVHDWPLTEKITSGGETQLFTAETGLLCNPNPAVDPSAAQRANNHGYTADQGPFSDDGAYYRNNAGDQPLVLGPQRLRGVFAFVTLSNGNVVTLDVDDWDAPCRRPDPLVPSGFQFPGVTPAQANAPIDALLAGPFSSIAPPMPPPDPSDPTNPYRAPLAYQTYDLNTPVSTEWFFPVSAPHRQRSMYLLRTDTTNGTHAPGLVGPPQLFASGAPIATQGDQSVANPSLVPTDTHFVDPSLQSNPFEPNPANRTSTIAPVETTPLAGVVAIDGGTDGGEGDASTIVTGAPFSSLTLAQSTPGSVPGVRFAWEDPLVQVNQNWVVTYEGELPGFYDPSGNPLVIADIVAPDGGAPYQTLTFEVSNALLCGKGIEDFAIGQQRADAASAELVKDSLPAVPLFDQRVADYVQLTDDIFDPSDPYWTLPNACWDSPGLPQTASARATLCNDTYGSTLDPTNPSLERDFPILEAYDDHLVIGRFGYPTATATDPSPPRQVVGASASNVPFLTLMQCCFHNQAHFNVRTGQEWSAVGSTVSFLHHIVASGADNRCVPSCDQRQDLMNGRGVAVPRPATQSTATAACPAPFTPSIDRDSSLALRNPMFAFLVWNGQDTTSACADKPPVRDMAWKFSTIGELQPVAINLAATTTGLSPQSMKFIDSLGQIAIVDGESQGLILIDLGTLAEAHAPYF
jgi:hypothetical protein